MHSLKRNSRLFFLFRSHRYRYVMVIYYTYVNVLIDYNINKIPFFLTLLQKKIDTKKPDRTQCGKIKNINENMVGK